MSSGLSIFVLSLCFVYLQAQTYNPDLEYELIQGGPQPKPPVNIVPLGSTTAAPAPPTAANSKTFAYHPKSKTWTQVGQGKAPPPAEDTLLWNQSQDKFLT